MSATAQAAADAERPGAWTKEYPFTDLDLAPPRVDVEKRANGEVILTNPVPLDDYPTQLSDDLRRHAEASPDRTFLAQRGPDGAWVHVSYAEARRKADAISQWLLGNGHGSDNPVACLSDNSVNFALLQLGAMQVGIPFLPVSPAYSLMSRDFARIRYVCERFTPTMIYAENLAMFKPALDAVRPDAQIVAGVNADAVPGTVPFDDLLATVPGQMVEDTYATVGPESIAKVLLTSGSTGFPKGVINTQRNLCASHTQMTQAWPFLTGRPPVICDWLPWNHTFGANWCFNMILRHGGTFYIDEGKPVPGKFEATLRNLRDVKVNMLLNVARAYDVLIPELEKDDDFARHVFSDLDYIFYAGAGLPQGLWDRLEALAVKVRGKRIPILTSLGSTETGPPATVCHWTADVTGSIGLPLPGLTAKLAPAGGKTEIRFKGPNISPGYYRDEERTAEAFDEEGFYKIGDAVRWADPDVPERGLMFDGRVAENFKLLTGTWVAVGVLRLDVLTYLTPLVADAAVTGENQEEVGLLAFANIPACQAELGADGEGLSPEQVVAHPKLHAILNDRLAAYNKAHPGSSQRVTRMLLMTQPAGIDAGEITDKGYLNQRAILDNRSHLVDRLYSGDPGPDVVRGLIRA